MSIVLFKTLGDHLLEVATWHPAREAVDQEFCYIDLGAVDNKTKKITAWETVIGQDAPSRARQLVRAGDVLVSTVRPNLNGVALIQEELDGATASTGFAVLRADPEKLLPEYLFQWVKTSEFIAAMVKQATGASYPAVSDRIIFASKLPVPSLPEQRRVAKVLNHADELIVKRRTTLSSLNRLRESIFFQMFGKTPNKIPTCSLSELIKVRSGDALVGADQNGGPYPVYGGNGITGWHDEYLVPPDTIVIGRVGVYCGVVHITERDAWVTDNALIVQKLDDSLNTSYLAAALQHANLNQYAGRSAQPLVSGSRIYPVEIAKPPPDDQQRFSKRVAEISRLEALWQTHLSKLSLLIASLQRNAFAGGH